MEIITELRKVGNSAAVIIPKKVLQKQGIKFREKVRIIVLPRKTLGQILWEERKFKTPTAKLMKELKDIKWI